MGKVKDGAKGIQGKSIDEYAEMINQEIIKNLLKKSKIEVGRAIEIHKLLKKNSEYNGENLGYKDDSTENKIESYTISSASVTNKSKRILFQVIDITSHSITIKTINMKGKHIRVQEVSFSDRNNLTVDTGKVIHFSDCFKYEGIYQINLLKAMAYYNIVVYNPSIKAYQEVLNTAISTFYINKYSITEKEYETTYKAQFARAKDNRLPPSWGSRNKTRAEISDYKNDRIFYIRGDVIDSKVYQKGYDGINDINERITEEFAKPIKRFYFSYLGISVYECPFKPGYINVDPNMAIFNRTQCYAEVGKKKIYYTLKDLDDLDYSHRFDIVGKATWTSCRIMISVASDMITILSAGTAVAAKTGIVKLLEAFWPFSSKITTINFNLSMGETVYQVKHKREEITDWASWIIDSIVPFVGTFDLIKGLGDFEPIITEIIDIPHPSEVDIVAWKGNSDGVFFRSNY